MLAARSAGICIVLTAPTIRSGDRQKTPALVGRSPASHEALPLEGGYNHCIIQFESYNEVVSWVVEYTDEFEGWWVDLTADEQEAIVAAVAHLERLGPGLGRPLVDTIRESRHSNMKQIRPPTGNIRILFAFDPRRMAILLIGGDKTDRWTAWYVEMIPLADRLYDEHLDEQRREGLLP
jgi:hypothetical protein